MQNQLQIAVFNADGSKRPESINRPNTLVEELYRVMNQKFIEEIPRLITITEFNQTAANGLNQRLPQSINFYGGKFQSGDYTATFYEETVWRPVIVNGRINVVWSYPGKYCGVVLENEELHKRLLYTSVHCPTKKSKYTNPGKTKGFLQQLFHDGKEEYDVDGIIIAGDFNMPPSTLQRTFGNSSRLAIKNGSVKTTKGNRSIDNIVTTDSLTSVVEVYKDYELLTHRPLFGRIIYEDAQ